jgi:RimJ/RimL family protein N-acetyltransferase
MKTLTTSRLVLRPFTIEDVPVQYEMNLDPEVSRYTGDGGVVGIDEIERRIKDHVLRDYRVHGFGRMAVVLKETDEVIGFCGLKYLSDLEEVDLGYRFVQRHWGKGIATEAGQAILDYGWSDLGLKRVIAWVLPENEGSVRVLDKLGFHFEKALLEDGQVVHQHAILKEE